MTSDLANNVVHSGKSGAILDIVVVLPPPLTGMTLISEQFVQKLRHTARVWPVHNGANRHGALWTLEKHAKLIFAILQAAFAGRGKGNCYFVLDARIGLWFNILEAFLLRFGFRTVILHHHTFSYFDKPDWRLKAIIAILGKDAFHITLGKTMTRQLLENYAVNRNCNEIGNAAFLTQTFRTVPREKLMRIGFLGNITREKGILTAIETIHMLEGRGRQVFFDIAGPIRDVKLKAVIDSFIAEAPDRRRALGAISGAAKDLFFSQVDVLLFPSHYANEALPVTIYEALAAAIPVIATPRGCIPDQLSGVDWVLDEATWSEQAAQKLVDWHDDDVIYSASSAKAIEMVKRAKLEDSRAFFDFCIRFGINLENRE